MPPPKPPDKSNTVVNAFSKFTRHVRQRGKSGTWSGGPLAAGAGTMVQAAKWLIRHFVGRKFGYSLVSFFSHIPLMVVNCPPPPGANEVILRPLPFVDATDRYKAGDKLGVGLAICRVAACAGSRYAGPEHLPVSCTRGQGSGGSVEEDFTDGERQHADTQRQQRHH